MLIESGSNRSRSHLTTLMNFKQPFVHRVEFNLFSMNSLSAETRRLEVTRIINDQTLLCWSVVLWCRKKHTHEGQMNDQQQSVAVPCAVFTDLYLLCLRYKWISFYNLLNPGVGHGGSSEPL